MQYRIKEVVENGNSSFYPQWKKRWFWRRFVWYGGEDGTSPFTSYYMDKANAIARIEEDKENRKIKEDKENRKIKPKPRKIIYHTV